MLPNDVEEANRISSPIQRGHLALLFGLYSLIYGFSQITAGIQVRHLGSDVQSLSELHHAA